MLLSWVESLPDVAWPSRPLELVLMCSGKRTGSFEGTQNDGKRGLSIPPIYKKKVQVSKYFKKCSIQLQMKTLPSRVSLKTHPCKQLELFVDILNLDQNQISLSVKQ